MTDIPTKWANIADQLKKHDAPKEIIDAALFVDASLGYNNLLEPTLAWRIYDREDHPTLSVLSNLALNQMTCTGCITYQTNCGDCPLGTCRGAVRFTSCLSEVFTVSNWLEEQITLR